MSEKDEIEKGMLALPTFVVPGQVPRKSSVPGLDALTEMPPPVNMAEARLKLDQPIVNPSNITKGLIEDPTVAAAFQNFVKSVATTKNEIIFRSSVLRHMQVDMKADPILRRALLERALSFYNTLRKSEGNVDELEKGEARGGNYHRRVTNPETGKHRYYYSEEDYAKRGDAHLSGADVLKTKAKKAVLDHVEQCGDKGCDVDALKQLTDKHAAHHIADAVREHVQAGALKYDGGMLKKGDAPPIQTSPAMQQQKQKAKADALKQAGIKTPTQQANDAQEKSMLIIPADVLQKGTGEGSRGGHVIGHTGSGKPIYAPGADYHAKAKKVADLRAGAPGDQHSLWIAKEAKDDAEYAHAGSHDFTPAEHHEAARVHQKLQGATMGTPEAEMHRQMSTAHMNVASDKARGTFQKSRAEDEMQKGGGEGSRGGHVIGHTSSGKPIYGDKEGAHIYGPSAAHHTYSAQDHVDAAQAHKNAAKAEMQGAGNPSTVEHHEGRAAFHTAQASKPAPKAPSSGAKYGTNPFTGQANTRPDIGPKYTRKSATGAEGNMKKGIEAGSAPDADEKDISPNNGGTEKVGIESSTADDDASKAALSKGLHGWLSLQKGFGDPPEKLDAEDKADAAEAKKEQSADQSDDDIADAEDKVEKGNIPPQFQKKPQAPQQAQSAPPQKGPPAPPAKQAPPQQNQQQDDEDDQQQAAPQQPQQKAPPPKPAQQQAPANNAPPEQQRIQKGGLHAWLQKAGIPGASDTSGGMQPFQNLKEGVADDLDQGHAVNGPQLDLDGENGGGNPGTPGGANTVAATVGGSDSGKTETLNPDDPSPGEMNGSTPYFNAKPGEQTGGPVGADRNLSKSTQFHDPADMVAPTARRWQPAPAPREAQVGVGVRAPAVQGGAVGVTATVIRKGVTEYTDASDKAIEQLQKGDPFFADGGPTLGTRGALIQKSLACSSCGGTMPAFLSVCPGCGGQASTSLRKSQAPEARAATRWKAAGVQEVHLPNGTKKD